MGIEETTTELFEMASAGDATGAVALCSQGCEFRQNGGADGGTDALAALISGLAAGGITTQYSDIRRVVGDGAVAEQHLVTLTRADGVSAACDVCVVLRFDDDGKIRSLDEYLDMTALTAVLD